MASLVKFLFSSQGKRCLTGIKPLMSSIQNVKLQKQVITSPFHGRYCSTKTEEPPTPNNDEPRIIYEGVMAPMIKRVKFFSLMSSAIGTSAIPYFYYNSMIDMSTFSFTSVASVMLLSYSIISPIVLHLVAKRYAIEISYDPKDDNYSLYTYSFWCRKKELEFYAEDVYRPVGPTMFTFVEIKGYPLFFNVYEFTEPEHGKRMLGYDRPIDLKMDRFEADLEDQSKKTYDK